MWDKKKYLLGKINVYVSVWETNVCTFMCNCIHYLGYIYVAALENVSQELAHSNSGNDAWNFSASQANDKAESSAMIAKELLNKA